jgi:Fe-S-cluster formation regulator IscX/YfhJ
MLRCLTNCSHYPLPNPPNGPTHSHRSAPNILHPDIPPYETGNYTGQDVVDVLTQILDAVPDHAWCGLTEIARLLCTNFRDLDPKHLWYEKLRCLVQAHPKAFCTQSTDPKHTRTGELSIRINKS